MVKHARATQVNLSIAVKDLRMLVIQIHDNGKSFDINEKVNGLGLSSMKKHKQHIGGPYQIHSNSRST